jgi:hypothetical protein
MDRIRAARWKPAFTEVFLPLITVKSKEFERPGPITPYTAQHMILDEIADALENGIHHIVCLKARQLGISTVLLALDIFWLYMNPGLQGAFVCDTEPNREAFRQNITDMMGSLPRGYQIPITKHDRTMLVLQNGSALQYMSAGKGKNSGLGRSRALNFIHATELGSWGDQKGYDTLMDTTALGNPNRLYIFESTALGYNLFYDCWKEAKEDENAKRTVFIGWWAKELYSFEEGSPDFIKWWGSYPAYTEYEVAATKAVYDLCGIEISPSQWAWYRKMADGRSDQHMMEEFPTTPEEAFQETGSPFFKGARIRADQAFIVQSGIAFEGYAYLLGESFLKMKLRRAVSEDDTDLRVWERPQPNAKYVIGVDPAYGSSEEADRTVISVWRCFSDKLVQVAEYCSPLTTTQNCAWVLAHLAGEYRDCMINLEINAGGGEVKIELEHLKKSIQFGSLSSAARDLKLEHILDSARWFFWRKPDNINGVPSVYNFKTSVETKTLGLNRMNDAYSSAQLIIRSIPLLDEMLTLKREGDKIAAGGRNHDDRVMAAMLANYAWKEWIQTGMMVENRTFEREMKEQMDRTIANRSVLSQIVPNFFAEQSERREALINASIVDMPLE